MATRTAPPKSAPRRKGPERASAPADPDPFTDPPRQQELTTANPEPGTAIDVSAARAGLAVISTQLAKFDEVKGLVPELERKYKGVAFAVDTPKGMEEAKAARKAIKDPRVELEHARVAAKAPLLKLGRDIEAEAQALTVKMKSIEDPIDGQITAQETKERNRKADLERRVLELQNTPSQCIGKTAAQLEEVLEAINSTPLETFEEYRPRAAAAQESARQQVAAMLAQAKQAEEAAELRRKMQAEEDRRAALQLRVNALADCLALPYRTAARVQAAIDHLTATPIGEDFEEYAPAAREKKVDTLAKLVALRDEKQRAEDAAAAAAAPTPAPAPTAGQQEHGTVDGLPSGAARIYPDEPGFERVTEEVKDAGSYNGGSIGATVSYTRRIEAVPARDPRATQLYARGRAALESAGMVPPPAQAPLLNTRGPMGMDNAPQATDHDRINDEGAQALHQAFGPGGADNVVDATIDEDLAQPFVRASLGPVDVKTGGEHDGHAAQVAGYEFVTGARGRLSVPDPDVVDAEVRRRPTDAELLYVIACHYDVPREVAASWLRTLDIEVALAQLSLVEG